MPQAVHSSISTSKQAEVSKGFFFGLGAGLLGLMGLYFALLYLQLGVPTRTSIWAYEINQKKLQRALAIPGPKLLLVGGSATLFGMQAELIEARLNYPTVNLGTTAGIGSAYILHLAKQAAKPGDTVLLVFEYNTYTFGAVRRDAVYVDYLFARDPDYFRALPWSSKFQIAMMMTLPRLRKGVRNRFIPESTQLRPGVYNPAQLTAHGDQLGHDAANRPAKRDNRYRPEGTLARRSLKDAPAFELIEEFVHWAETNNIRVWATYPNILEQPIYHTSGTKKNLRELEEFYERLQVPIIGSFEESMMPPSAFFDTCYHLTREGATIRTERLIPHLAAALNRGQK